MSGFVVWMTGLSGAGKSTLASLLTQELSLRGVHVECLDGDEVRKNLSHGLGFSREDRDRNVRRIGYVARMVARSGSCAITAAISPYRALRDEIRSKTENFLEVYCECPMEVLTKRDPKGLYKRALAGEIKNFTGVDDPYEAPEHPDVLVRTDLGTAAECVAQIIAVLEEKGLLAAALAAGRQLPPPFGGEVFEAREATAEELSDAPLTVEVDQTTAENILAVANGFFSPLAGFMSEREAVKVTRGSALESGTPWWNQAFVLPLGDVPEPDEGTSVTVTRNGKPIALARVDRVWSDEEGPKVAGPLEAVAGGVRPSIGARAVRRVARQEGWTHLGCLFALGAPGEGAQASLDAALALTDGVVVASRPEHSAAWSELAETHQGKMLVIVVPSSFPTEDARARLVVQKSVGASANLIVS